MPSHAGDIVRLEHRGRPRRRNDGAELLTEIGGAPILRITERDAGRDQREALGHDRVCAVSGSATRHVAPQPTAFLTSAPIRASSTAVSAFNANAVGHMLPSSRLALSLKPNVAYRVLNFCAL